MLCIGCDFAVKFLQSPTLAIFYIYEKKLSRVSNNNTTKRFNTIANMME